MIKRIVKILVFISLVFILDKIGGYILKSLYNKTNDPTISKLRYSIDSTNQDILILGSSRAMNQFIPAIIQENTGYTTYNCGFGGQGLKFSFIQLNESLKRHKPKLVIIEISPNVLFDPLSEQKLKILLPFYKRDTLIYNTLTNNKPFEKIKFASSIYPYNSTIATLFRGLIREYKDSLYGFVPINRIIDTTNLTTSINIEYHEPMIPLEKLDYLKRLITLCHNEEIKIVIVVCPFYKLNSNMEAMIKQIEFISMNYSGVIFWDYSKSIDASDRITYFYDNLHLNTKGAEIFSELISQRIKMIN